MCADLLNGAIGGCQKLNGTLAQNDLPLGVWGGIAHAAKGGIERSLAHMAMARHLGHTPSGILRHAGDGEIADSLLAFSLLILHIGKHVGEHGIEVTDCARIYWLLKGNAANTLDQLGWQIKLLKQILMPIGEREEMKAVGVKERAAVPIGVITQALGNKKDIARIDLHHRVIVHKSAVTADHIGKKMPSALPRVVNTGMIAAKEIEIKAFRKCYAVHLLTPFIYHLILSCEHDPVNRYDAI